MNEPDSGAAPDLAAGDSTEAAQPREQSERRYRAIRWALELVVIVAAAFLLALVVQQFVVKPYVIPSPSMEPTLMEGDRVLVNRLVYHFRAPKIGDIIVFHPPGGVSSDPFIKRVVAVGGDTVSVHDGVLWVNGQAQQEPFVMEHPIVDDSPEVTIPAGYIWAMGDNRNNSGDSRVFGPVKLDEIIGEAIAVYWPLGRIKGL